MMSALSSIRTAVFGSAHPVTTTEPEPDWYDDDRKLNPASGERAWMEIKSNPKLVTTRLEDTWAAVSTLVASGGKGSGADNALNMFARAVKDIYYALGVCQEDKQHAQLSLEVWSRMYDAGLPDLMQDIIMQSCLWSLPRVCS